MGHLLRCVMNTHDFSRREVLAYTGSLGGVGLAGCMGEEDGGDGTYEWVIGTSSESSATHGAAVGKSNVLDQHSDMITLNPRTSPGTSSNPRLLEDGQIDVAQGSDVNGWTVNTGRPPHDDPVLSTTLCQTTPWMKIEVFVLKRDTEEFEDITTVDDIPEDVPFNWGPPGTPVFEFLSFGFEVAGYDNPEESFNIVNVEQGDEATAMEEGRMDISWCMTINNQILPGYMQELDARHELDIVAWPWSEDDIQASEVPLSYDEVGQDVLSNDLSVDPFAAIAAVYTTYFKPETPQEAVYEYVDVLMERYEEVQEYHGALGEFGPEYTENWLIKDSNIPVHPGMEEWAKEQDIWNDDLTSVNDFDDPR